jgi:hypothetical protein
MAPFAMIIPPLFDDGRDRPKRRFIRIFLIAMAFAFIWVSVEVVGLMNPRQVSIWEAIFRFGWLAVMAILFFPMTWPGCVLLVGGSVAAIILGEKVEKLGKDTLRRAWRWGLSPLMLSAGILVCGALFWDAVDYGLRWPEFAIHLLLLAHIPLAALLAFFQPGARWFVLALSVAIFGYSFGAWVMSGMAITGDWL